MRTPSRRSHIAAASPGNTSHAEYMAPRRAHSSGDNTSVVAAMIVSEPDAVDSRTLLASAADDKQEREDRGVGECPVVVREPVGDRPLQGV